MTDQRAAPSAAGKRVSIQDAVAQAAALHETGRHNDAERIYRAVLDADPRNFAALQMLGILCAQAGHPGEGAALLYRAVQADPASAGAHANLANVLRQIGRRDDALTHCDRALALDAANAGIHNIRAGLLLDMKRHDEAIASCDAALAIAPRTVEALYHRGAAQQAKGLLEAAVASYDEALAIAPGFARALNNRGNALRLLGRLQDALATFDRAVAGDPRYALAWCNRASVLRALGRHADAVASADRALAVNPRLAEAHANRGGALNELERHKEALASCERALALEPDLADAHVGRGLALTALARTDDALGAFDRALAVQPGAVDAICGRATTLHRAKRLGEAVECYDRALASAPGFVAAINGRAGAYREQKRLDEALAEFERALALEPGVPQVHHNRGAVLYDLGRHEEAIASYDRALALKPDFVQSLHHRVAALSALKRYDEALATGSRLLALDPDHAEAHHNRGSALSSLLRFADAVDAYTRALALKPDFVASLESRASVLAYLTRHDEAVRDFERVLALDPDHADVAGALQWSRLHCCDWRGYGEAVARLAADAEAGKRVSDPFPFVTTTWSAPAQLRCAQTWVQHKLPAAAPLWNGERYTHDRIRVAYLSADLHEHATAYLLAGVLERHDHTRFETIGVSFGPDYVDPMRTRLRAAFDRFVDVHGETDQAIAALLRELEVDIAVDLKGYTYDSRPGIFALRPAPVHVSYLGFPGTMGAPWMDYLIADATLVPTDDQRWYSERVVWLPDSYQANDDTREIPAQTPSRAGEGLPAEGFVFCSFNSIYKVTPPVFDVWMRLLQAVEGSVLWQLEGSPAALANLRREAAARGVDPARLVFAPRCDAAAHLARHRLADLFLDTLPVNAHTTASDALWAGLPIVTCLGATFAGRVAGSLLRAAGLPELVAASLPEYEALALALAHDGERLAGIRARLAAARSGCALFDTDRFRRHLESAYQTMWERQRRGEPPSAFAVPALR